MAATVTGREHQVTIGHWSGQRVTTGQITDALAQLALRARQNLVQRTSVLTLVVKADNRSEAGLALTALRGFEAHRPARTLVLITEPGDDSAIDGEVTLYQGESGDVQTWGEDVVLTVRGEVSLHLDAVLRTLVVPDLPVAVWYPAAVPDPEDPLSPLGSAVLVDSKFADDDPDGRGLPPVLVAAEKLATRCPVVDLSWLRLRAWREPLARLFEGADMRPFLNGVTGVEVTGNRGPRMLLAGWIGARLDLSPALIRTTPGPHAGITLQATDGGRTATVGVQRIPGERLVGASAHVDGGLHVEVVTPLEPRGLHWSLGKAIAEPRQHPVYESSLRWAVRHLGAPPTERA